ncbi:MAG TPA: GNAT family N-acetyltransferase [Panacibacter sp.]|nr:GNAT family N-acetyltransferase [Panacibacter sp.]
MNVEIRRATVEDANIIAPLFEEYRVWYHQVPDADAALNFITERLQFNESVIFIAFINDEAVGFTQLYPIFTSVGMKRTFLLNDLFVKESARGKHVGKALLNAAKKHGKSLNCKWLMLQTSNDNYRAQALYEKDGWIKESDFFYSVLL